MERESLIKARELILEALEKEKQMIPVDKVELMNNISHLLNPDTYQRDIQILILSRKGENKW